MDVIGKCLRSHPFSAGDRDPFCWLAMLSLVAWPGINCLLSPVGSTSGAMSVRLLRVLRNLELDLISVREQNELFRLLGLVW